MSDDDASAYEVEEAVQRGLGPSEVQAAFNKATVWFLSESPALDEREDGSTHVDTVLVETGRPGEPGGQSCR